MKITPLKMWVQNVLPVVYDDSLSYYEMVGKINEKTNEIIKQVNENTDGIEALNKIIEQLGDVDELRALLEQVETIINDLYTTDIPAMDSENGSAGVEDHAARSDHSHPSDSSKADVSLGIDGAVAGQYVKIKTVEAGVPTEFENGAPHEIPSGGTAGQALRKESSGDYAADWADVHEVPSGGTIGQALKKNSNTNYDASWGDTHEIPAGGNANNVLIKDSNDNYDTVWTDTPAQMGSIAHINNGDSADMTYQVGECFIYKGQLYQVINSPISSGESLISNNKMRSTNIDERLYNAQPYLVYDSATIESVTVGAGGYVDISQYRPSRGGLRFSFIETWGTATPAGAFTITSNGVYLLGNPNTVITGLKIAYYSSDGRGTI